jgi:hypothetical protein
MRFLTFVPLLASAACTSARPGFALDASVTGDASADVAAEPSEAALADAAPEAEAGPPLPCGLTMCDAATQYCLHYVPEGGLEPDGGDTRDTCTPVPASCLTTPTCSCIQPLAPCGSAFAGCVEAPGSAVDVTCTHP